METAVDIPWPQGADFGACRAVISFQSDHRFRHADHRFQSMPITLECASRSAGEPVVATSSSILADSDAFRPPAVSLHLEVGARQGRVGRVADQNQRSALPNPVAF